MIRQDEKPPILEEIGKAVIIATLSAFGTGLMTLGVRGAEEALRQEGGEVVNPVRFLGLCGLLAAWEQLIGGLIGEPSIALVLFGAIMVAGNLFALAKGG